MIEVPMTVSASQVSVPLDVSQHAQRVAMDVGGGVAMPTDYNLLYNKPQIEGVELAGNKSFEDLNLQSLTNTELETMLKL